MQLEDVEARLGTRRAAATKCSISASICSRVISAGTAECGR
jgi:hypothetical protein